MPRVIELGVTSTSAVSEPRTTATAATNFARFRDDPAFEAYGTDDHRRRRGYWWCVYAGIGQISKIKYMKIVVTNYYLACERIYVTSYYLYYYTWWGDLASALDLRLHDSTPSNHL